MSDVLIIDESSERRLAVFALLTQHGFRVHECSTGEEGLARAAQLRPHLIMVDRSLRDVGLDQFCQRLRSASECAEIPLLVQVVRSEAVAILECLRCGVDDIVEGECPPELVLARVQRLVGFRQLATASMLNEQLAQVGRLVAGIVHEIRGPLGVIRGNAELLRLQLGETEPMLQYADPIIRSVQILQARLEHLMATVRSKSAELGPMALLPLVREAVDYFRKGYDRALGQIEFQVQADEPESVVLGDAGRLLQVLLNVLSNAREAILATTGTGRIVVTHRFEVEPDLLSDAGRPGIAIEVSDTGPGIPAEILERIFEPYFTTKETGTGYGLYLARQILREHGGILRACNRETGGACFSLWLPLHTGETGP